MKKILIVAGNNFEDVEMIGTMDVFTRTEIQYEIVSTEKTKIIDHLSVTIVDNR